MNFIYSIIYHPSINCVLRNIGRTFSFILPNKFKIQPSGVINVKINDGKYLKLKTNQTSYVTRKLFWNGSNNYEYTSVFTKLIMKVNTFVDIGANLGYYSILGAKLNQQLRINAFEPSVGLMNYLKENVNINGVENRINLHLLALSDQKGEIDFFEKRNNKYPNISNLSGEHNIGTKQNFKSITTKIQSQTLDDFVQEKDITSIDLIKVDTEGCEDVILKASKNTINELKPIIICETLFNVIENELEAIMLEHGYEFYNFMGNGLKQVNSIKRLTDNGVRDCFFVHPSKKYLIEEFLIS